MENDTPALPAIIEDPAPEIARLALQYRRANGPVITLVNRLGLRLEEQVQGLPPAFRARLEAAVAEALARAFKVARLGRFAPATGPAGARALAALTGAAGGAGGLVTALAEIPVTVTVFLHAIAREAAAEGFDPEDPGVQAECLRVLASGTPLADDDGVDTSFLGARLALTGGAVQKLIATVAPAVASLLTRRLAAQAVPVLGAVTGAALNAAYLGYYREMAAVRFGLMRLAATHGAEPVLAGFVHATGKAPVLRV